MTPEQKREFEANQFAMAILMPKEMIRKELQKHKEEAFEDLVKSMAKKFCVSRERMSARLAQLELIG